MAMALLIAALQDQPWTPNPALIAGTKLPGLSFDQRRTGITPRAATAEVGLTYDEVLRSVSNTLDDTLVASVLALMAAALLVIGVTMAYVMGRYFNNQVDTQTGQLRCELRIILCVSFGEPPLEHDVLVFHPAELVQCSHNLGVDVTAVFSIGEQIPHTAHPAMARPIDNLAATQNRGAGKCDRQARHAANKCSTGHFKCGRPRVTRRPETRSSRTLHHLTHSESCMATDGCRHLAVAGALISATR